MIETILLSIVNNPLDILGAVITLFVLILIRSIFIKQVYHPGDNAKIVKWG